MKIRIFYAGMLLEDLDCTQAHFRMYQLSCSAEIYNGAYVYSEHGAPPWCRMDMTPCLLSDVPKELQLLNLIL